LTLQRLGTEQGDRPCAEALHGECEIRQALMGGKGFPREAQGAHVEGRSETAIGLRHDGPEPSAFAQTPHEAAARAIHVVMIDERLDLPGDPSVQVTGKLPVAVLEERPGEKARINHVSLP
jgi:hypothetical protein